jgi:SAM-dependent methyltransferase
MIEEAHRRPIPNARFVMMRAEDLPDELGAFDVITFAASFHWMDRPKVASIVREMLRPDGAIVQIDAPAYRNEVAIRRFEHPLVPWHEIIELRKRYLGPHQRAGQSFRNTSPSGEDEVFRAAGFLPAVEIRVPDGRILDRTIDDVVANVFSSSSTAPHLFADRLGRFETDLRAILSAHAPAGLFSVALPANRLRIWRLP